MASTPPKNSSGRYVTKKPDIIINIEGICDSNLDNFVKEQLIRGVNIIYNIQETQQELCISDFGTWCFTGSYAIFLYMIWTNCRGINLEINNLVQNNYGRQGKYKEIHGRYIRAPGDIDMYFMVDPDTLGESTAVSNKGQQIFTPNTHGANGKYQIHKNMFRKKPEEYKHIFKNEPHHVDVIMVPRNKNRTQIVHATPRQILYLNIFGMIFPVLNIDVLINSLTEYKGQLETILEGETNNTFIKEHRNKINTKNININVTRKILPEILNFFGAGTFIKRNNNEETLAVSVAAPLASSSSSSSASAPRSLFNMLSETNDGLTQQPSSSATKRSRNTIQLQTQLKLNNNNNNNKKPSARRRLFG